MSEDGLLGRLYKNGEIIVEEGTMSRTMYVIQSGKVNVVKNEGERETILASLGEGDIFGEMSLFDASPRSATVKAIGETRVLIIEHEGLLKKIKMDPTLAFRIIKQMSQRIRDLNSRLSAAQRTINQANNILQQLNKNKDISIEDLDTNLHSE
jgi:CRP-like cAMP-binding protein